MCLEFGLYAVPTFYETLCEPIIEIAGINRICCDGCWSNFQFSIIPLLALSHPVINICIGYILVCIFHCGGCEIFVIWPPKKLFPPVLCLCCWSVAHFSCLLHFMGRKIGIPKLNIMICIPRIGFVSKYCITRRFFLILFLLLQICFQLL